MSKVRKARLLAAADAHPIKATFEVNTPYHWTRILLADKLDYWPSTGRWFYRNTTHRGGVEDLAKFIKGWEE